MPVAVFSLGYFLSYLYRTTNAVIGSHLQIDLGIDQAQLGVLTSVYFLTFALAQIPLGILLDRYGPRRVNACLLLLALTGAMITALAPSFGLVFLGRALIGLGVAGGLMSGFKLISMWFPISSAPAVNGMYMLVGSCGAIAAGYPLDRLLLVLDWREIFILLAVFNAIVVTLIVLFGREHNREQHVIIAPLGAQLVEIVHIVTSVRFIRLALVCTLPQCIFLSIHTLWVARYLTMHHGVSPDAIGPFIGVQTIGIALGFLLLGFVGSVVSRRRGSPLMVGLLATVLFVLFQIAIALGQPTAQSSGGQAMIVLLWFGFGFFGTGGILFYPVLVQSFDSSCSGRVITALNSLVFLLTFVFQALIGYALVWATAMFGTDAYAVVLLCLVAVQVFGLGVYVALRPKQNIA